MTSVVESTTKETGGNVVLLEAALELNSGVYKITGRDRNTECIVCKRDWNTLSEDPLQLRWQSTRSCEHHYLCSECYYRIAFNEEGDLHDTFKCPQCRAEEKPHTDKRKVQFPKFHLLELLNTCREKCLEIQQHVHTSNMVTMLKAEIVDLKADIDNLKTTLSTIENAESMQSLAEENKRLKEELISLSSLNKQANVSVHGSHEALKSAVMELSKLKQKHAERIALMEKDVIILNETISNKLSEAEKLRDQMMDYKDQIQFHSLSIRIEQELNGLSLTAMKADLLDKFGNISDDFIPEKLQEDIERRLHHTFAQQLMSLGKRHYDDSMSKLASIKVAKYMLSKPCIREALISQLSRHLTEHEECNKDCGKILGKFKDIMDGIDTITGLEKITEDQILSHHRKIVKTVLPPEAVGLLTPSTNALIDLELSAFLKSNMPEKYKRINNFAHNLGIKESTTEAAPTATITGGTTGSATGTYNTVRLLPPPPALRSSKFVPILPNPHKRSTKDASTDPMPTGVPKKKAKASQTMKTLTRNMDDTMCIYGNSIFNLTLKKEEFNEKFRQAKKQWKDQKSLRDAQNVTGFYCFEWNTQLLENSDMTRITCIRRSQRHTLTDDGASTDIVSEPCRLTHRCMYLMASGTFCLSSGHNYMQHAMLYDMPLSEAEELESCGIITPQQKQLVKTTMDERYARLDKTRYGQIKEWISRFSLLEECELPVVDGTDIINNDFFKI